jgi:hypothetical protein
MSVAAIAVPDALDPTMGQIVPADGASLNNLQRIKNALQQFRDDLLQGDTNLNALYVKFNELVAVTNEPTGFPNRTDSSLSFAPATRTFTISPAKAFFEFWQQGVKYTKNAPDSAIITDVSGVHLICYDEGVLTVTTALAVSDINDLIINKVLVAYVYWNATDGVAYILGDERHGTVMSGRTHEWLHDSVGATYNSGFLISGYTEDTDTDAALTFEIGDGKFFDEDIGHDVSDGAAANKYEQQLNGGDAEIPIFYRDDTDGSWTEDAATTLPYKSAVGGSQRLAYNKDDGDGTFSQVEVTDGKWVSVTLVVTNDWQYPVKAIQGQNEYADKKTAVEDAVAEIVSFGNFVPSEMVVLYRFVLRTKNTFGGTKKTKIEVDGVTDFRASGLTGASAVAVDHGGLTGLNDDDHAQYLLEDGTRVLSADWDAGSFKITAEQFESDIAAGTAPLIVASNTVVPNLNADLLDGLEAAAFMQDLVDDTTPQLAGILDCQENEIDNVGDITHDDNTASDWTFESLDLDKDIIFKVNDGGVSTEIMRFDGSANRVGFGIAVPDKSVHVYRSGENAAVAVQRDGGATSVFNATASIGAMGTTSAHDFRLTAGGNAKISIQNSNGFVGINDITPSYQLDVNGNIGTNGIVYTDDLAAVGPSITANDPLIVDGKLTCTELDTNGPGNISGALDLGDELDTNGNDIFLKAGSLGNTVGILSFAAGAAAKATFSGAVDCGDLTSSGDVKCGGTFKSSDGSSGGNGVYNSTAPDNHTTFLYKDGLVITHG